MVSLGMSKTVMTPLDVSSLEGEDLVFTCRELALEMNQLMALQAAVCERIEYESRFVEGREGLAQSYGCRSAVELIQRLTGESSRTVSNRLKVGRRVARRQSLLGEKLPPLQEHVAVGLETGVLSFESAVHVCALMEKNDLVADPADLDAAERYLVQAATGVNFGGDDKHLVPLHSDDIRYLCVRWDHALDPDGSQPSEEERQSRRSVNLGPVRDGLARLTGYLTSEVAAAFAAVSDSLNNPRAQSPSNNNAFGGDTSNIEGGTDGNGAVLGPEAFGVDVSSSEESDPTDSRSRAQKDHDALATALNVALASRELPVLQGANATIVVEVKEEDLVDPMSENTDSLVGWLVDHQGSQTPVRRSSLNHLFCGAQVQSVVRNSLGKITALGTPTRIFGANQRRAIALRDGGCVIPGCTVPPAWCEIHHVVPYADGGPTHTDNGVTLCRFHHRTIDSSGWEIQMRDGVPYVRAPEWLTGMYPTDCRHGWVDQGAANQETQIHQALQATNDPDPTSGSSSKMGRGRTLEIPPGPDRSVVLFDIDSPDDGGGHAAEIRSSGAHLSPNPSPGVFWLEDAPEPEPPPEKGSDPPKT